MISKLPDFGLSSLKTLQGTEKKGPSRARTSREVFLPTGDRRAIFNAFQYHGQPIKVLALRSGLKDKTVQDVIRNEVDREIGQLRQMLLVAGHRKVA